MSIKGFRLLRNFELEARKPPYAEEEEDVLPSALLPVFRSVDDPRLLRKDDENILVISPGLDRSRREFGAISVGTRRSPRYAHANVKCKNNIYARRGACIIISSILFLILYYYYYYPFIMCSTICTIIIIMLSFFSIVYY